MDGVPPAAQFGAVAARVHQTKLVLLPGAGVLMENAVIRLQAPTKACVDRAVENVLMVFAKEFLSQDQTHATSIVIVGVVIVMGDRIFG